jgi:hypothetical protein
MNWSRPSPFGGQGPETVKATPMRAELQALLSYWRERRQGGSLPYRKQVLAEAMLRWKGRISLFEVLDGGADFRFRLHGSEHAVLRGTDMTGRRISELPEDQRIRLFEEMRMVLSVAAPVHIRRSSVVRDYAVVERLMLPLLGASGGIQFLLMGAYRTELKDVEKLGPLPQMRVIEEEEPSSPSQ